MQSRHARAARAAPRSRRPPRAVVAVCLSAVVALATGVAVAESSVHREHAAAESKSQGPEIPPYIVELDRTHATIAWRTRTLVTGQLTLLSYSDERALAEAGSPSQLHRIRIDGLEPGTRYRYEVGGSHRGQFTTAGEDDSMDIVVFGHSAGTTAPGEYPTPLFVKALIGIDPDFAIATGDITYHASLREFSQHFFRPFERFLAHKPIYVCAANHESAWPWLHGINYDAFRLLFPYDYPSLESAASAVSEPSAALPVKDAYYSVVYKHLKLVALPFTRDRAVLLRQLAWAEAELDASQSEFNLVLLGGGYTKESGADLVFERLSQHRVDLALAGDGSGAYQATEHGVPFFFAGDGGLGEHPFYYLEFERYRFTAKLLTSGGQYTKFFPDFYSKRGKRAVQDLTASARRLETGALLFADIGRSSTEFDGLRLVVPFEGPKGSVLELCWSPASSGSAADSTGGCESMRGYRGKWLLLEPGRSNRFTIELPRLAPLTGEPYVLGAVRLRVLAEERRERLTLPDLVQAKLFRDAPNTRPVVEARGAPAR